MKTKKKKVGLMEFIRSVNVFPWKQLSNTGLVDGKDEAEIRWRMGSLFEPCSVSSERVERAKGAESSTRSDVAAARLSNASIKSI